MNGLAARFVAGGLAGWVLAWAGCSVGPDYHRPDAAAPAAFSEEPPAASGADGAWRVAAPGDQALRPQWWELFGDPELNALEGQLIANNQTLRQAEANFRAARASIRFYRAAEAPTIGTAPAVGRERVSANEPYFSRAAANGGEYDLSLPFDLNYEVDLWGRVRRTVASARDQAQAAAADLAAVRLTLQADLALDYFNLRAAAAQVDLLADTVKAYQDELQLTQDRYDGGAAPLSDVVQARTQLESARVQATDIGVERAAYAHAVAVLTGRAPGTFALPANSLMLQPPALPAIPGALPSQVLERRPDVAAAERRMAAANEQIGIARAAYYPTLSLSAVGGFLSSGTASWLTWPSRFWAVGPMVSETLFDNGRRRAGSEIAVAQYDQVVASYRQTVLTAFQEVEDNLSALRQLEVEARQQHVATDSAIQSRDLFQTRYEGGIDTYLQVITWQTAALQNERNDIDLLRRRLQATILLAKAVGGGWQPAPGHQVAESP